MEGACLRANDRDHLQKMERGNDVVMEEEKATVSIRSASEERDAADEVSAGDGHVDEDQKSPVGVGDGDVSSASESKEKTEADQTKDAVDISQRSEGETLTDDSVVVVSQLTQEVSDVPAVEASTEVTNPNDRNVDSCCEDATEIDTLSEKVTNSDTVSEGLKQNDAILEHMTKRDTPIEEATPIESNTQVEETTLIESDTSAKETAAIESDTKAEETTSTESDIRTEETTPIENDIRAEETTPIENDTQLVEETPIESDICTKETTPIISDAIVKETTPIESDICTEDTPIESDICTEDTPIESDICTEEITLIESNIYDEETTPIESYICTEETTPRETDTHVEETTPTESDIYVEETTPTESDTHIEETIPTESDTQVEETAPIECDTHVEETTPLERDTHVEETSPITSDSNAEETTPIENNIRMEETTPTENDTQVAETKPLERDTCTEETTSIESHTKVEETTPAENDAHLEETTPTESDTHVEEPMPVESDSCVEETTPIESESDTCAEKTTPVESDSCVEETTPIESDTHVEEAERETQADIVSSQHLLDDNYTEENDTVSEYPATTESSDTLSSSGFEDTDKRCDYDTNSDGEQKHSGSKKQKPGEDAGRESTPNESERTPKDRRTREISKTLSYEEKKSSSSDVRTEQLVEEAITGEDGVTAVSHELEKEHCQKEQEESIDMKASIIVIDGMTMEDEERSVKYQEAESVSKESKTEEELIDTDGTVLGRCRIKYIQHRHSSDSHSVSSKMTAFSTDDAPESSETSTNLSKDGKQYVITPGGTPVLSDISEADENDAATLDDFDISPEANATRNVPRKNGTDGRKYRVITGRDECSAGKKPVTAGGEQTWAGPSSGHTSTNDDEGIFSQQEDVHQSELGPAGDGRHVSAHQSEAKSGSGDIDKVLSLPSVDVLDPRAQSQPCLPGLQDRFSPTGEVGMAEERRSVSGPDSCRGNDEEDPNDAAKQEQTRDGKSVIYPLQASRVDDGLETTADSVERVTKTIYERSHVSAESASVSHERWTVERGDIVERIQQSENTEEMVRKESSATVSTYTVDAMQDGSVVSTDDIHEKVHQKTQDNMADLDSDDSLKQVQDPADDSQDNITDDTLGTEECPSSGIDSNEIDSGDIIDNDDSSSSSVDETKLGVYTDDMCCDTTEVSQAHPDDSQLIKPALDLTHQAGDETEDHNAEEVHSSDSPSITQPEEQSPKPDNTPKVIGDDDTDLTTPCKDNNHTQPVTTTDSDIISKKPEISESPHKEENKPVLPVILSGRKGRSLGDLSHLDSFVEEGGTKKDSEAGRRVSRRDVHDAVRTLKQRSKSADRRPRPQSYHGNHETAAPRGRHYDWNTYHFFPDNADSSPFVVDRRRHRSQGAQYVDEEWIRDLYYYKQLEIEQEKQALLNDDDVSVTRQFRSEADMQVTSQTPSDAVTDGNGNVRPCDSESSGESSENEQKRWHKSALHVKKTKRKENRIQNDDDDDGEIPIHISPVLSALKASPSVQRREHKRIHSSSPWRGNTTASQRKLDDSVQGESSSCVIRDNQQRFEMLQLKRRALESTSEESMTSPQGTGQTVHEHDVRRWFEGERAPNSRSQEDVCFEEHGGPFTVHGDFNWRHELRVPKDKTGSHNRPQRQSGQNGQMSSGDPGMPWIPKCQYDFVSMEAGRKHYIAEGGFHSPAFYKRSLVAPRCEFSSSFENIYDRVNLSPEVPSLTKIEHDKYQQMRHEYLRSKKQELLGPPPSPPVCYRSIHHEDVAPRRGGIHADNRQEPSAFTAVTTTHAPSVASGNKFRVRDRDIAPLSGTTSSGSDNYGPCIFAFGYMKADGVSSTASQLTSQIDHPTSTSRPGTVNTNRPSPADLTKVSPCPVDSVPTSPLGEGKDTTTSPDHETETRTLDAKQLMLEESQRYSEYKADYLRRRRSEHGSSVSSGDELRATDGRPIIPPDEYEYVLRRRLCDKHTQGVSVDHQRQARYDDALRAVVKTASSDSKTGLENIEHVEPRIVPHAVNQVDQRRMHGQVGKDQRKDPVVSGPHVEPTTQTEHPSSQKASPPVQSGVSQTSPRLRYGIPQTSSWLQSSVSQTSPPVQSSVSQTSPWLKSSVQQTSPCVQPSVSHSPQSTSKHFATRPSDQYDRRTVQPCDTASTAFDREYSYDSWKSYTDSTRMTPRELVSLPTEHGRLNGHGDVRQNQPRDSAHRMEYSPGPRPAPALWQDGLVSGSAKAGPKLRKQKQRPHSDYWVTSASSPQISSPDRVNVASSSQRTSSEVNLDYRTTVSSKWPDLLREHREVDSVHRTKRQEQQTVSEKTRDRSADGERTPAAADRYESYVRERRRNYMAKNSAEISSGAETCSSPGRSPVYIAADIVRQRKQRAGSDVEHGVSSPDERNVPLFFPRTASDSGKRTRKPESSAVTRSRSEDNAGETTPSVASIKAALFGEVDPGLPPPVVTASHHRWESASTKSAGSVTSGTGNCFQFLPLRRYDNDSDDDVRLVDYASFRDGRRRKKPNIIDDLTELEEAYERLDLDNEYLLDRAARRDYPRPLPPTAVSESNVKRLSITNLKKLDEIQQRVENPSLEYAKRWLSSESGLVEPAGDVTVAVPPAPVTSLLRGPRSSSLPRKFGDDMAVRKYRRNTSGRSNSSHVTLPPTSYVAHSPSLTPTASVDGISRRSGRAHTPEVRTGSDVDYLVNRAEVPVLRTRPASEADIYHDDFAYRQLRRDVAPRQRSQSVERPVEGQPQKRRNSLGATSGDGRPFARRKSLSHGVASMVELFTLRPSLSAPDLSEKSVFSNHYNCRGDLVTDDPKYSRYALPPRRQQTPRIVKQRYEMRSRLRQANGAAPEPAADVSRSHRSPPDGALDVNEPNKTKVSGGVDSGQSVVTDVGRYKVQMKTARTTPEARAQPNSGKIVWCKSEGPLLPDYPRVKMVTVPVAVNDSERYPVVTSGVTGLSTPTTFTTTARPDHVSTTRAYHVTTIRADNVSTTRADNASTTRSDHVCTAQADRVTRTRPAHVSTTRADHVSAAQADHVSAALEYKAKAAELDRRLTQLKETLNQTGKRSVEDRRTTYTTSETQRLEALMADRGTRAPVTVLSTKTSTNCGDYKYGPTIPVVAESRVTPVVVSSTMQSTNRAYGDGIYGSAPAISEPQVTPDVPPTMPSANRDYGDGRYGPPHAFAEPRMTVNVVRQPPTRRFEPAPGVSGTTGGPSERCRVGASSYGGEVYRRRQTAASRYEMSDGEMTDATDTTLDVLVRRNMRPSSTDTFDFSELDVASVTSGDDDLDRLKQYCRSDPASWSQPIGMFSSSSGTTTAVVTETSSTTRLTRHKRTEEVVQRGSKVERNPSFKELVHTFEEQSSAFLRAPIRLNRTAVAQGDI